MPFKASVLSFEALIVGGVSNPALLSKHQCYLLKGTSEYQTPNPGNLIILKILVLTKERACKARLRSVHPGSDKSAPTKCSSWFRQYFTHHKNIITFLLY